MEKVSLLSTIPHPEMPTTRPDISSLGEVDFYKFKMLYYIWRYHIRGGKTAPEVEFSFQQRGDAKSSTFTDLPNIVSQKELEDGIAHVLSLEITEDLIAGLKESRQFEEFEDEFFSYLRHDFHMSDQFQIKWQTDSGKPDIRVKDSWDKVTFWETMVMGMLSSLRTAKFVDGDSERWQKMLDANDQNIRKNLTILLENPDFQLALFGARRRANSEVEEYNSRQYIEVLAREGRADQILGIANTALGIRLNKNYTGSNKRRLLGTYAHELPMVMSGIQSAEDDRFGYFHSLEILQLQMQTLFGDHLTLPDTFTSSAWFGVMSTPEMRKLLQVHYIGDRQDSGDPTAHIVLQEAFARHTLGKTSDQLRSLQMFPSDGLDFPKAAQLIHDLKARGGIDVKSVGIGTKTTFDFSTDEPKSTVTDFQAQLPALNMVMKASAVDGVEVAKRGDGTGKRSGSEKVNQRLDRLIENSIRMNHPEIIKVVRSQGARR